MCFKSNKLKNTYDIIVIGGGAAGFFTAINSKEKNPKLRIAILEKGKEVLSKVRISGGGRCNVTNVIQDKNIFLSHYPRGAKELRGPFQTFGNEETINWFEQRGVPLWAQADGRVFPKSDSSQSIIACFVQLAEKYHIPILTGQNVTDFHKNDTDLWEVTTTSETFFARNLVITTGSSSKIWNLIQKTGHNIITPTPSLFSFNIKDASLQSLMGIAMQVGVKIKDSKLQSEGNALITHWGLSGPAILKLSAWGSKELAEKNYNFTLIVNWLNQKSYSQTLDELKTIRDNNPKKTIYKNPQFGLTHRFWEYIMTKAQLSETLNFAEISKVKLQQLATQLTEMQFHVEGKSTFKDEFVTAGGVDLKEVNFKTMESKLVKNLYFAGEVLDIDAITGGFNFQNAWTGGWIVSENLG